MSVTIRSLAKGDESILQTVAPEVFDHAVNPDLASEFLNDPRHHLIVALEDAVIIGFVSAVHYVHPDKRAELFINEVAVAPTHRERGIGRRLLLTMLDTGRNIGCRTAWVGTESSNLAAMRLYQGLTPQAPEAFVMFTFPLSPETDWSPD